MTEAGDLTGGDARSPWLEGAARQRDAARGELRFEVVVVGGGILGVVTAYRLACEGIDVALVEAGRIAGGTSGHTTAKVSALQQTTYTELEDRHGADAAAAYAAGNRAAVDSLRRMTEAEGIACEMRDRDAVVFARDDDERQSLEREAEAAARAGLDVELEGPGSALAEWVAAVRLPDQLELHPRLLLDGLVAAAERRGATVFEGTRVRHASKLPGQLELRTVDATLQCERAVLATLMPILDRGFFFSRLTAERSYSLGFTAGPEVGTMAISAGSPTLSLRSHPRGDGELLILGGAAHTVGGQGSPGESYETLEAWGRDLGLSGRPAYRWSAHDLFSADGLPYAGSLTPTGEGVLFAGGFRKWGLTNAVWCADVLTESILGRDHDDAGLLRPNRLTATSLKGLSKEALKTTRHMARWFRPRLKSAESLAPGEAGLVRKGLVPVAAYRDEQGELRSMTPACTHLGCPLTWNEPESTWDCPCHGSRFGVDGSVLQGPATRPLAAREDE